MSFKQGFTMVEMVIAVAVIGLLAAIAFPTYQSFVARTEVNNCINYFFPLRMNVDNLIQTGVGVTLAALGTDNTGGGNCVGGLTVASVNEVDIDNDGTIDEFDVSLVAVSEGNTMTLIRDRSNGAWTCSSSNSNLAPALCP